MILIKDISFTSANKLLIELEMFALNGSHNNIFGSYIQRETHSMHISSKDLFEVLCGNWF